MAVTKHDNTLPNSLFSLCLGTAVLLGVTQWYLLQGPRTLDSQVTMALGELATALPPLLVPAGPELVVDLSDRRVYVYHQGQQQHSYPIAIGQTGWETPTGTFHVQQMQVEPSWLHPITREVIPASDQRNPLRQRWIGFAQAHKLAIGFHGTDQEELVGQAVSHGCLRMRNRDIVALYNQISLGTRVTVRP